MQLYNYQGVINKKPIYCLCKKKEIFFMKCLDSNSFIELGNFYD